jgi:hypothetical protein
MLEKIQRLIRQELFVNTDHPEYPPKPEVPDEEEVPQAERKPASARSLSRNRQPRRGGRR